MRAARSATAPLLAHILSMRLALSLNVSIARSTAVRIRSGESSLVDAESIAAKHRSESVKATSVDEQSLAHGQRLPAFGTPINGCLTHQNARLSLQQSKARSAPRIPRPRTPLVFFSVRYGTNKPSDTACAGDWPETHATVKPVR